MDTGTAPRVDIGALAGSLYGEAAERIARTVVLAMDWLQKVGLVRTALIASDGLEVPFAQDLKTTLEHDGVKTWGLAEHLERLLGERA